MAWSKEQIQAIESNHTNELVNAGAGSGKTAVLSEHVLYLLKHGYNIENFLIVTFTNDAANEMKGRIKDKIFKDPDLTSISNKVDAAHIETFDAFALFIVSKYSYLLNLNSNVSILDENVEKVKTKEIIDSLIRDKIVNDPIASKVVTEAFLKKYNGMVEAIAKLLKQANLQPDPDEFLNTYVSKYMTREYIENLVDSEYKKNKALFDTMYASIDDELNEYDAEKMKKALAVASTAMNQSQFSEAIKDTSYPRKSPKQSDYPSMDSFKEKIMPAFEFAKLGSKVDIVEPYLKQAPYTILCFDIAIEARKRINAFKREKNAFGFNDIMHMCIKILNNPVVNKEIKDTFTYIMVDEYQDTSDLQEEIIRLIGNNNVFMVGDVKQSIYLFRYANCKIFEDKYEAYKANRGGHKIDMTLNFRSRKEFMDDLNDMFSSLMRKDNNPIDYALDHISHAGNAVYDTNKDPNLKYGIYKLCYEFDPEGTMDRNIVEAKVVAEDIIRKVTSGVEIFDKDLGKSRKVQFKDFAIIIDRGKSFPLFKTVFDNYGIPLFVQNDENITSDKMTYAILSTLKMIECLRENDFGEKFRHAFTSLARSFLFDYNDNDILKILKSKTLSSDPLVEKINDISVKTRHCALKDIISEVYDGLGFDQKIITIGSINDNQRIFDEFYKLAESLDDMHYDLAGFIELFEKLYEEKLEIKNSSVQETENSVIILNIHKSKGREFPICYFPILSKQFRNCSFDCPFTISNGVYQKSLYSANVNSMSHDYCFNNLKKETFEEKIRLLYVALTRAREAAILVSDDATLGGKEGSITKAICMADFLKYCKFREDQIVVAPAFNNKPIFFQNNKENKTFDLRKIALPEAKEIETNRASKQLGDNVDNSLLKYGEKLHYLLEIVDFRTKNTKFVKDLHDKAIIDNVLKNPILAVNEDTIVEHEYHFVDSQNQEGIIDCLIIDKDVIKIIDFKLKNIDDSAYDNQLKTYKNYIKTIANGKPIKMYLLSLIDNVTREVIDDEN